MTSLGDQFLPPTNLGRVDEDMVLPANDREIILFQYFVVGLKDGEIQGAMRMANLQDLKSAVLYALKMEVATQASCRDRHFIRGARVIADAPCESPCIKKMKEEIQD
ncbi:uncharacterized protein TNCV_4869421 [Trichonephila clavipes]|nr:uncharacterized protein TNCV_4869421 [Trichonephila clavipes]